MCEIVNPYGSMTTWVACASTIIFFFEKSLWYSRKRGNKERGKMFNPSGIFQRIRVAVMDLAATFNLGTTDLCSLINRAICIRFCGSFFEDSGQ